MLRPMKTCSVGATPACATVPCDSTKKRVPPQAPLVSAKTEARQAARPESACLQIVALPVIRGMTEQVPKPPLAVAEVRERQPDIALALIGGIVHRHQQSVCTGTVPGKGQEAIPGPVAVPGGDAFEQCHWPWRTTGWRSTVSSRS